ncbi:MAG: electron transport complex subunit RsxG [Pseudomonadales bacterium]|nr:electron transport complex subunit RsxG [Pseudomonadales bacterium]
MSIFTATGEQPAYRQRIGYQAMLLAGICGLVATLILFGNISTKSTIAENLRQDILKLLDQVLPPTLYDNDALSDKLILDDFPGSSDPIEVHIAKKDKQIIGFAFPIVGSGYSGDIKMLMGIDAQGEVLGVRVITHAETPGLGDKIEIGKDQWITEFNGESLKTIPLNQWAVKKDGGQFDQFTGATITPRAVANAVREALEFYQAKHVLFFQDKNADSAKDVDTPPPAPQVAIKSTSTTEVTKHE